jgi:hypothetical protein
MSEIIKATENLAIELKPSVEAGEPLLTIRTTEHEQQLSLTLDDARNLMNALPGVVGRLVAMKVAMMGQR